MRSPRPLRGLWAYPVDVTDSSAVDGAVAVERDLGPISIAVNAAGILRTAPAVEVTDTDWAETFAVNAGGVLHVSRAGRGPNAAQARRGDRDGRLQRRGRARVGMAAYAASKAAALMYTKCLGLELAAHGIRCNVVAPG